ncbi:hypothetical protein Q5752_004099 [Cryptotrichosporon argae]
MTNDVDASASLSAVAATITADPAGPVSAVAVEKRAVEILVELASTASTNEDLVAVSNTAAASSSASGGNVAIAVQSASSAAPVTVTVEATAHVTVTATMTAAAGASASSVSSGGTGDIALAVDDSSSSSWSSSSFSSSLSSSSASTSSSSSSSSDTTFSFSASSGDYLTVGGNVYLAETIDETSVSTLVETLYSVGGGGATSEPSVAMPSPTSTSTSSAAAASQSLDATAQAWVDAHNTARAQYGAGALTWNADLVPTAQSNAEQCDMVHTNAGENIAGQSGALSPQEAVQLWMDEASSYDWSNPGYSDATGHFTQVVWKASTELGCYTTSCAAGTLFGAEYGTSYVATCEYRPVGNVVNAGEFQDNVGTYGS